MNFAERAFRYLFRKKGKAIILFWVLLITETMILSTVTILRASEVARIELLEVTRILKNHRVMKADNLFQKMEIPLLQVVRVVKMMLGLSVVSSVLVITLLLSMWMRARKKEIAIYVSLGKTKVDLFMQIILECFSVFGFSTIIALYTGDKMLIVLEKFLDWKSIGAFTSMQIYAQNKDICYLILSGTIILLLSISISLFPILCTKPKKILAEMEG